MIRYLVIGSGILLGFMGYKLYTMRGRGEVILSLLYTLSKRISQKPKNTGYITINQTVTSASVSYTRYDKEYQIHIPYNKDLITKMTRLKVYLVKDGERVEITQQPGIPYMVSARMLGGEKIIIVKDNNVQKEYKNDEIPQIN